MEMNNLLDTFEKKQIESLTGKKRIPAFRPGDTIKVTVKIKEGDKVRLQGFEGVCISRKNNSLNSKFTVRKVSHGEGVERVFPLFSPIVEKIEVIRKGDVKRAKLYYLRSRTGKSARISDKDRGDELDQFAVVEQEIAENTKENIDEKNEDNNKTDDQKKDEKIIDEKLSNNQEEEKIESKPANTEVVKQSDEQKS